jgi:hypothetical protein
MGGEGNKFKKFNGKRKQMFHDMKRKKQKREEEEASIDGGDDSAA